MIAERIFALLISLTTAAYLAGHHAGRLAERARRYRLRRARLQSLEQQ